MKKILIIGPIGGYFGRDIEVNLVAKALQNDYKISFFSTSTWNKNSASIRDIENAKYTSLNSELIRKPVLFLFSMLSLIYNRFRTDLNRCVRNKVNLKIIKKFDLDKKILNEQIINKDIVFCFVQLSTTYLENIIETSKLHNAKLIIRPTGTIHKCPIKIDIIKKVDLFIHHSDFNKNQLRRYIEHNFKIIDQGSGLEDKLLKISPIQNNGEMVFGFIGRFSDLKGIDEIIDVSIDLNLILVIAGDGEKRKDIELKIKDLNNFRDLGILEYRNIHKFFELVDVMIINSEHETGPLTGLEAMCSGRFIISKKVGAMPKRLETNANIWIEQNLHKSVLDILKLDKKEIIKIANRNREIYKEKYRLEHIQQQYVEATKIIANS